MRTGYSFLLPVSILVAVSVAVAQQAPQFARDYVYGPGGRLVVTVEPDNYPPGAPSSIEAAPGRCPENGVTVSWGLATDIGSGVAVYRLYRNGALLGEFTGGGPFTDAPTPFEPLQYTYAVTAVDRAGHEGGPTSTTVTTPDLCFGGYLVPRGSPQAPRSIFAHVHLLEVPGIEFRYTPFSWKRIRLELSPPPQLFSVAGGGAL